MASINQLSKLFQNPQPVNEYLFFSNFRIIQGQLITIGSRPGMGKTLFLLYMLQNFMRQTKDGILFVSNEENEQEIFRKFACQISSINSNQIDDNLNEIVENHRELTRENVLIAYNTNIWEKLKETIVQEIKQNNISCLLIDKLQGLYSSTKFKKRSSELEYILHEIKNLAVEYNLIVVVSTALNRRVERRREGGRPYLSDLRSSSAIEEISDIVIFLHRPEYYGITEDDSGNSLLGVAEIIIAKNRSGKIKDFNMKFDRNIPKFEFTNASY